MKRIHLTLLLTLLSLKGMANGFATIDAGYRYDSIHELLEFSSVISPTFSSSVDTNYHNIQNFRLGGHGAWQGICSLPLLVKAGAHYSWTCKGDWMQDQFSRARLNGHSVDATVGLGYVVPFCGVDVAPLIGYSYDDQHYTIKDPRLSIVTFAPLTALNDASWKSKWYGPWIGVDFYFADHFCCSPVAFQVGYEFHYGWAKTNFKPAFNDPDSSIFGYQTRLGDMIGHVFRIGGEVPLWKCWIAGVEVGYTFWHNMHTQKSAIDPSADTGLNPGVFQRNAILLWRSLTVTFNLGRDF